MDRKIEALRAYRGVLRAAPHPRSEQVLRGLAAYRGGQRRLLEAEAFQTAFVGGTAPRYSALDPLRALFQARGRPHRRGAGPHRCRPDLLLTALAIAMEDGTPVVFRRTRVGRGARSFTIFKFRSMPVTAPSVPSVSRARFP